VVVVTDEQALLVQLQSSFFFKLFLVDSFIQGGIGGGDIEVESILVSVMFGFCGVRSRSFTPGRDGGRGERLKL
jgi:hypothetical protein